MLLISHSLSSGKRWLCRFERFRQASGFTLKSKETQVNPLIYSMREEADGVLYSVRLSDNNRKKYNTVLNLCRTRTCKVWWSFLPFILIKWWSEILANVGLIPINNFWLIRSFTNFLPKSSFIHFHQTLLWSMPNFLIIWYLVMIRLYIN